MSTQTNTTKITVDLNLTQGAIKALYTVLDKFRIPGCLPLGLALKAALEPTPVPCLHYSECKSYWADKDTAEKHLQDAHHYSSDPAAEDLFSGWAVSHMF